MSDTERNIDAVYKIQYSYGFGGSYSSGGIRYFESYDTFKYNLMSALLLMENSRPIQKQNKLAALWGRLRSRDDDDHDVPDNIKWVKSAHILTDNEWRELDFKLIPPDVAVRMKHE